MRWRRCFAPPGGPQGASPGWYSTLLTWACGGGTRTAGVSGQAPSARIRQRTSGASCSLFCALPSCVPIIPPGSKPKQRDSSPDRTPPAPTLNIPARAAGRSKPDTVPHNANQPRPQAQRDVACANMMPPASTRRRGAEENPSRGPRHPATLANPGLPHSVDKREIRNRHRCGGFKVVPRRRRSQPFSSQLAHGRWWRTTRNTSALTPLRCGPISGCRRLEQPVGRSIWAGRRFCSFRLSLLSVSAANHIFAKKLFPKHITKITHKSSAWETARRLPAGAGRIALEDGRW